MGRRFHPHVRLLALAVVSVLSASVAACGDDSAPTEETSSALTGGDADAGADGSVVPRGPSPTTLTPDLQAIGLDVRNLPALHELDSSTRLKVMRTFTLTLGVQCGACHDDSNYAKPTPQKDVATKAWDDIVRKLTFADGGAPIYCDSCHYGTFHFLDRSNRPALMAWMETNFVETLQRKDGAPMDCSACHDPVPTDEHR